MTNKISSTTRSLTKAAKKLSGQMDQLEFGDPVAHVYNPLAYAWKPHQQYLSLVSDPPIGALFLGMNPGPWGMAQTGVPFGEVAAVRDWMGIDQPVEHPDNEHPKRIVEGFDCARSEVSGRRLWGLFRERFETPQAFFANHFVVNYCPLIFMEDSARNRTPDKLPAHEREQVDWACDEHLRKVIEILRPRFLVGVGAYAEKCFLRVTAEMSTEATVTRVLHPSPASPAANKDWAGKAASQLIEAGVWDAVRVCG